MAPALQADFLGGFRCIEFTPFVPKKVVLFERSVHGTEKESNVAEKKKRSKK